MNLRLKKIIDRIQLFIRSVNRDIKVDAGAVLLKVLMTIVIITLSVNLYNSLRKGMRNRELIAQEEARLAKILSDNYELHEQVKYYSSVEYQQTYARDSQSLAQSGEVLYQVIRPDQTEIEYFARTDDPILLDEHSNWWTKLLGVR